MKLATTTTDFRGFVPTQEEAVRHIRQAGFRFADYNFGIDYAQHNGAYSEGWRIYMARMNVLADELGMQYVQAHAPMGSPIKRGEGYKPFIDATIRCIECCAILGIPNLVVHSGYERGITKEEAFERNSLFYSPLLDCAEQYGVNVLVENFNKMSDPEIYWIDNAPDLRALIDYINHPLFHACWDTGHGNMQEMPQHESLRILDKHVYALHVQDNLGNTDAHLAPFFGSLNLDSLMHGLQEIGYKGYFTFEACRIFLPASARRPYDADTRLKQVSLGILDKAEALLYEIGKFALESYDCFEM